MGFLGQGAVERDDVRSRPGILPGRELHAEFEQVRVLPFVHRQHLAPQVPHQSGHDAADPTGAHDGDGLSGHVEADQPVESEVAVTHPVVGTVDLAVQGQDQCKGVLRDRIRRVRPAPA